jgi:tRNA modification GTPase
MSVVFALATPAAKSAICVFRVSGKGCLESLNDLIEKPLEGHRVFEVRPVYFNKRLLDTVGVISFKGPESYTGEDSFEVYAHGGLGVMSLFVDLFKSLGFDEAPPGEFTKRAFLNGKLSLNEAEAVVDVIDSSAVEDVYLSSRSLSGDFSKAVIAFAEEIDFIRVRVEGEIDFSDEGQEFLDGSLFNDLVNLITRFDLFTGGCLNKKNRLVKNKVLFVGPVNSGKSSVFNRLLGFERALVSNIPGTTRDLIESEVFYNDLSFSIFDSAGLRDTDDLIEARGIALAVDEIKNVDVVVGVFEKKDSVVMDYFEKISKSKIYISLLNKVDLGLVDSSGFDCCLSAKTGEGFELFKERLKGVFAEENNSDSTFLVRQRHINLFEESVLNLRAALDKLRKAEVLELAAEDLKIARSCLDEVVGFKSSDDLLGDIFSTFCIGK